LELGLPKLQQHIANRCKNLIDLVIFLAVSTSLQRLRRTRSAWARRRSGGNNDLYIRGNRRR
jgi:hypothetical protein